MVTETTAITVLNRIFSTLVNDGLWSTTDVTLAVDLISDDPSLNAQLTDLANKGWVVQYQPNLTAGPSVTIPPIINSKPGTIALASLSGIGTFSKAAEFVGYLSYEIGHAEDPDLLLQYFNSDLSIGANVAAEMLGEGKAAINNEVAEENIFSATGTAIFVSQPASGIIEGAETLAGTDLLSYYWDAQTGANPPKPGTPTTVVIPNAPTQLVNDLQYIDNAINRDYNPSTSISDDSLIISQNPDLTDSMTVTVHDGSISSNLSISSYPRPGGSIITENYL